MLAANIVIHKGGVGETDGEPKTATPVRASDYVAPVWRWLPHIFAWVLSMAM